MEPNNNQPINTNPLEQAPASQPVPTPSVASAPPTPQATSSPAPAPVSVPVPETPKSGSKKGIILIVILLILILGIGYYVFFAKNQLNTAQKKSIDNTSTVIPTAIVPTATPATVDEVQVASPDADLNGIEKDIQGL